MYRVIALAGAVLCLVLAWGTFAGAHAGWTGFCGVVRAFNGASITIGSQGPLALGTGAGTATVGTSACIGGFATTTAAGPGVTFYSLRPMPPTICGAALFYSLPSGSSAVVFHVGGDPADLAFPLAGGLAAPVDPGSTWCAGLAIGGAGDAIATSFIAIAGPSPTPTEEPPQRVPPPSAPLTASPTAPAPTAPPATPATATPAGPAPSASIVLTIAPATAMASAIAVASPLSAADRDGPSPLAAVGGIAVIAILAGAAFTLARRRR